MNLIQHGSTEALKRPLPTSEQTLQPEDMTAEYQPEVLEKTEVATAVTYDAFFIDSTDNLDRLLSHYQSHFPEATIAYISSPQTLDDDDLKKRTTTDQHQITIQDGLLFSGQADDAKPVILLLDFRNMTPAQRAGLNELFDTPSRVGGKKLAANIHLVSLLDQQMDRSEQQPNQDFWGRVYQPGSHLDVDKITGINENSLSKILASAIPEAVIQSEENDTRCNEASRVINLTGKHWRSELFGSVAINEQDNLFFFRQGELARLSAGQGIILEDAPWDDPNFSLQMAQLLTRGEYSANGDRIKLPRDIKWFRRSRSAAFINQLKNQFIWESVSNLEKSDVDNVALLNKSLFPACLKTAGIDQGGCMVSHNALEEWLGDATILRITSPLSYRQWLTLLIRLQALGKTGLRIVPDQSEQQPEPWQAPMAASESNQQPVPIMCSSHLDIVLDDSGLPGEQPEPDELLSDLALPFCTPPLNVQVAPDSTLQSICNLIEIPSLEARVFHLTPTAFLSALQDGRQIDLFGLEHNPDLAAELEPLLLPLPSLNLNGFRYTFPRANIRVHWPASATPVSPLWQQALTRAVNTHESGGLVKDWLKARFDLSSAADTDLSDDMVDQVTRLVEHINQLSSRGTRIPRNALVTGHHLLNRIWQQALLEKNLDQCDRLTGNHFHKAVNSVLIKPYRSEPEIYHYLKWLTRESFQPPSEPGVDRAALARWLSVHPEPSPALVKAHFWQLLRHLPLPAQWLASKPDEISPNLPESVQVIRDVLPLIRGILVLCAPEPQQTGLQKSLKVTMQELAAVRSRLRDWPVLNHQLEIRLRDLFYAIGDDPSVLAGHPGGIQAFCRSTARQLTRLKHRCPGGKQAQHTWTTTLGEQLDQLLPSGLLTGLSTDQRQALIEQLASTEPQPCTDAFWELWQNRRMKRLAAKIKQHPVLFIKGEAGAGKSWMASKVATRLNPNEKPTVYNISPDIKTSDLFGQNQCLEDQDGKQRLVFKPGPLTRWASMVSDQPVVLILDEANLAKPAIWECLRGLYETAPCIYCHGRRIPVTAQHRVVMTGNPDYFNGRAMNVFLKQRAPELFFHGLPEAFKASQIVKPLLRDLITRVTRDKKPLQSSAALANMIDGIQTLYQQYRRMLPAHELTPRDLTDAIARMASYLDAASPAETAQPLSLTMLHGLIFQAMADTMPRPNTDRSAALQAWYSARFPCDDAIVSQKKCEFIKFYTRMSESRQATPGQAAFDFSNATTRDLAYTLWLELERRGHEHCRGIAHSGRHATLIEGPAGRGKDVLLDYVTRQWLIDHGETVNRFQRINASINNWPEIERKVTNAFDKGHILCISELNLIESKRLEGLLNDLLTRRPAPGFHLFATINPSHFSGRHALSPALQSRFTHIRIEDYSLDVLERIVTRQVDDARLARSLARIHGQLTETLKAKGSQALPSTRNLSRMAAAMGAQSPVPVSEWHPIFADHYGLFMRMANWKIQDVRRHAEEVSAEKSPGNAIENPVDQQKELTVWLNGVLGTQLDRPAVVSKGPATAFNPDDGVLTLSTRDLRQPVPARQTAIIRALAEQRWQAVGLPLDCPGRNDALATGLYTWWQQEQTQLWLGTTGLDVTADQLFPMTETEIHTLNLEANHHYQSDLLPLFQSKLAIQGLSILLDTLRKVERETGQVAGDKLKKKLPYTAPAIEEKRAQQKDEVNIETISDKHVRTDCKENKTSSVEKTEMTVKMREQQCGASDVALGCAAVLCFPLLPVIYLGCKISKRTAQQDFRVSEIIKPVSKQTNKSIDSDTTPRKRRVEESQLFLKTSTEKSIRGYLELGETSGSARCCKLPWTKHDDIICHPVKMGRQGYKNLAPGEVMNPDILADGQDRGVVILGRNKKLRKYPLPGVAAHQKLIALSVSPKVDIRVMQDCYTGTILLENQAAIKDKLHIDYVLEPENMPLSLCAESATSAHLNNICPESLRAALDNWFSKEPHWLNKFAGSTLKETASNIIKHCSNFQTGDLVEKDLHNNTQKLLVMIREQKGVCRHRSMAAAALMSYFGIACRLATSATHQWIQYSLDNGRTWHEQDLGGADHDESVYIKKTGLHHAKKREGSVPVSRVNTSAPEHRHPEILSSDFSHKKATKAAKEELLNITAIEDVKIINGQSQVDQIPLKLPKRLREKYTALNSAKNSLYNTLKEEGVIKKIGEEAGIKQDIIEQIVLDNTRPIDKNIVKSFMRALLLLSFSCREKERKLFLMLLLRNIDDENIEIFLDFAFCPRLLKDSDLIISLIQIFEAHPDVQDTLINRIFDRVCYKSFHNIRNASNKEQFDFFHSIMRHCINKKPELADDKIGINVLLSIIYFGDHISANNAKIQLQKIFRIHIDKMLPLGQESTVNAHLSNDSFEMPPELIRLLKSGKSLSLEKAITSLQDITVGYSWESGVLDEIRFVQQSPPFVKHSYSSKSLKPVILLGVRGIFNIANYDLLYIKPSNTFFDIRSFANQVKSYMPYYNPVYLRYSEIGNTPDYGERCEPYMGLANNKMAEAINKHPDIKTLNPQDRSILAEVVGCIIRRVEHSALPRDSALIKIPNKVIYEAFLEYFLTITQAKSNKVIYCKMTGIPEESVSCKIQSISDVYKVNKLTGCGMVVDNEIRKEVYKVQIKEFLQEEGAVVFDYSDMRKFVREFLGSIHINA